MASTKEFYAIYKLLEQKGPGYTISIYGTEYKIESMIGTKNKRKYILGTTKNKGKVRIYDDWDNDAIHHGTRIGGICRGKYSIYDWYKDNHS